MEAVTNFLSESCRAFAGPDDFCGTMSPDLGAHA